MTEIVLKCLDGTEIGCGESVKAIAEAHRPNLECANLRGTKNVTASNDCAAEILKRAAQTEEQERWAMWPLAHREWYWNVWMEKWASAPEEIKTWIKDTLCADPAWGYREKFEVKHD